MHSTLLVVALLVTMDTAFGGRQCSVLRSISYDKTTNGVDNIKVIPNALAITYAG